MNKLKRLAALMLVCVAIAAQTSFPPASPGAVTETNLQRKTCVVPDTQPNGGSDAYVVAFDPVIATNYNGLCVMMTPDVANTGAATLDAGIGPKAIETLSGDTPPDNAMTADTPVQLAYNTTADVFMVLTGPTSIFNSTVNNYYDLPSQTPPSNPGMGKGRLFLDSGSGDLDCLDSSGGDCLPSSSGGGPKDLLVGASLLPAGAAFFEPYTVKATNDFWAYQVLVFPNSNTATDCLHFAYTAPNATDKDVVIGWTSTATTGSVRWTLAYRVITGNDTVSLDQGTAGETLTILDVAPSATDERMTITATMTATIAAGDTVQNKLCRTSDHMDDDLAASVTVHAIYLEP